MWEIPEKNIYQGGKIGYDEAEKTVKRRWLKQKAEESLKVSLGVSNTTLFSGAAPNNSLKPNAYRRAVQAFLASNVGFNCTQSCWPGIGLAHGRWAAKETLAK